MLRRISKKLTLQLGTEKYMQISSNKAGMKSATFRTSVAHSEKEDTGHPTVKHINLSMYVGIYVLRTKALVD